MYATGHALKTGSTERPQTSHSGELIWKALTALALGALLGALAALPYDQLLGLSSETCTVLRSGVAILVLTGLNASSARDLVFKADSVQGAPSPRLMGTASLLCTPHGG
jgi:hypothetical protein